MKTSEKELWPSEYPKSELRADVEAMIEAISQTLISNLGDDLEGLWLKGSAAKPWDTPIDYVPEVSDVDIHYRTSAKGDARLADLESALVLHEEIAKRFSAARPTALHTPRPQFLAVAHAEAIPDYVPPPPQTVLTLYGDPPAHSKVDPEVVRLGDARRLVENGDPQFLAKQTTDLIEKTGWLLYQALRPMNFRVSPVASRALTIVGVDYETSWSANRTNALRLLREKGQTDLANHYVGYYEASWEFFVSGWRNQGAGRSAFRSAVRALESGRELGRKYLHLHADYRTSQSV